MRRALWAAALLALLGGAAGAADRASPRTLELTVDGMVCGFCAQGIEERFRSLEATEEVYVSLERRLVAVSLKPRLEIGDDEARRVLTEAGYTLRSVKRTRRSLDQVRAASGSP